MLALTNKCPKLKVIVSIDDLSPPARRVASAWAKQHKVELLYMTESTSLSYTFATSRLTPNLVEEQGKENRIEPTLPGPEDIATICYTSGTTNVPKGALLSHYNLVSAAIAFLKGFELQDGIIISYLPLAHIYQRVNELLVLYGGCAIGYFTGDPLRLLEDIQVLKPTIFPGVPRVLNRLALGVQAAMAQPGLKGTGFVGRSRYSQYSRHNAGFRYPSPESRRGQVEEPARNWLGDPPVLGPVDIQEDACAHWRQRHRHHHWLGAH